MLRPPKHLWRSGCCSSPCPGDWGDMVTVGAGRWDNSAWTPSLAIWVSTLLTSQETGWLWGYPYSSLVSVTMAAVWGARGGLGWGLGEGGGWSWAIISGVVLSIRTIPPTGSSKCFVGCEWELGRRSHSRCSCTSAMVMVSSSSEVLGFPDAVGCSVLGYNVLFPSFSSSVSLERSRVPCAITSLHLTH